MFAGFTPALSGKAANNYPQATPAQARPAERAAKAADGLVMYHVAETACGPGKVADVRKLRPCFSEAVACAVLALVASCDADAAVPGSLLWARRAGGAGYDFGAGVDVCSDGSLVVTGCFEDGATFGPGEANETSLATTGWRDIFLARYAPDGSLSWAEGTEGTSMNGSGGLAALSDDSAVITGRFQSSLTFAPGASGETTLTSAGLHDIFLAKYDPGGTLVWAKRVGGTGSDYAYGIAALSDDSVAVTGFFVGTVVFGQGDPTQTTLVSAGGGDAFVARYNSDGTLAWAKRAGGANSVAGFDVAALPGDSIAVTGEFGGAATFGAGEPGQTVLTSAGMDDIFVARFGADGSLAWAKRAGGPDDDGGSGVTTLTSGSVAVVGGFAGTATFGQGEANEASLTSLGMNDVFVARYGPGGTLAWVKKAGGIGYDYGAGVAALPWDFVVITGFYESTATFGYGGGNETTLASAGSNDIFVAEYERDGRLAWAKRAGGDDSDGGISVAVRSDGSAVVAGSYRSTAVFGPGEEGETLFSSDGFNDLFLAAYAVCAAPPYPAYDWATISPLGGGCVPHAEGGGPPCQAGVWLILLAALAAVRQSRRVRRPPAGARL